LISTKILGTYTQEELRLNIKQNLAIDTKKFFIVFAGIDSFEPNMKKLLWISYQ